MQRRTLVIIACLLFGGASAFLLLKSPAKTPVESGIVERYAAAEGKVEIVPGNEVEVSSELEGRLASFPVQEGDTVQKGDTIAVLANNDIKARLKESESELAVALARLKEIASGARKEEIQAAAAVLASARASLEFAETSRDRYRELYQQGYISRESLDEKEKNFSVAHSHVKEAREAKRLLEKGPKKETLKRAGEEVNQARAAVKYFRALLEKSFITAPISGKLIRKYLEQGEGVTKEDALAAVADTSKLRINAEVDETDIAMVGIGYHAEITTDAFPNRIFRGKVSKIADYAGTRRVTPNDQAKNLDMKVVQVKIGLEEKTALKPGMTVDVKILPETGIQKMK